MTEARGWTYWTRNKLQILEDYVSAFNIASQGKASERIYIDLMAGRPDNFDRDTREQIAGSAKIALASEPPFTRLAFGEMPDTAATLDAELRRSFPGRDFRVYPGDCNITVAQMLADLEPYRWAPTFAFLDQQAAELHWETIRALASFRRVRGSLDSPAKFKAEQWILWSPTFVFRGLTTANPTAYIDRVDRMYGTRTWRRIFQARREGRITAPAWRAEMVNLLRWRLEQELGYKRTFRIPMKMLNGTTIYDMVFATDHDAGARIMSHLYKKAAEREPKLRAEVQELRPPTLDGDLLAGLEGWNPEVLQASALPAWQSEPCWDPSANSSWEDE